MLNRRTVHLYISHIVTFVSQERRVKNASFTDRRYQQRSSVMYNFSYPLQGRREDHAMRSPAYLPSRVLFESVGQLSSSEPSSHCNAPSQRESRGTHSPLRHLNSVVWSHSGCASFSPAAFGCRVCVRCVVSRRHKRVVARIGVHS